MSILPGKFQVVDTCDSDELGVALRPLVGRAWLGLSSRNAKFHCRISHLSLGDVGLFHGEYEGGLEARFPDFNTYAGSAGPLNGTGEHKVGGSDVTVSEGRGAIMSPGSAILRYGPGFEHLSMTLRPAALMGKLAAIIGELRLGPLHFDPAVDGNNPQLSQLDRLIRFIVKEVELSWPLPPILQSNSNKR